MFLDKDEMAVFDEYRKTVKAQQVAEKRETLGSRAVNICRNLAKTALGTFYRLTPESAPHTAKSVDSDSEQEQAA